MVPFTSTLQLPAPLPPSRPLCRSCFSSSFLFPFNNIRKPRSGSGRFSRGDRRLMESTSESQREERMKRSELFTDIRPEQKAIIYSPAYDITFLGLEKLHPFDSTKWRRVVALLIEAGILRSELCVKPREATEADLLVAHTPEYLKSLSWSANVALITELPPLALLPNFVVQSRVLRPMRFQVGGTVLGVKLAVERGWAINVGGGFHHCSAGKGEGFCAYADISLAVHFALGRLHMDRVMIVDLDAHQGNGHARDFEGDERVYILDMYNSWIFPQASLSVACKLENKKT
eukprot:TRINITY_DN9381_c0_g1_i1.p1 TRINITY_DN9381_c0_g1~~TRINITY_DN9381_c0_g1_i1.p1  ORF type:complete len:289 (-),score=49.62 TRINITY_DN9381_c0_g1_i1:495-1361(-)